MELSPDVKCRLGDVEKEGGKFPSVLFLPSLIRILKCEREREEHEEEAGKVSLKKVGGKGCDNVYKIVFFSTIATTVEYEYLHHFGPSKFDA